MTKDDEALRVLQEFIESGRAVERSAQRLRDCDRWSPRVSWAIGILVLGFIGAKVLGLSF